MRSVLFTFVTLLVAGHAALADTKVPGPLPLGQSSQPWVGRLRDDAVAHLPRAVRSAPPKGDLLDTYWGVIADAATWREIVQRDPQLAVAPAIDFAKEAVLFVLDDTPAAGELIRTDGLRREGDGSLRLIFTVIPSTRDSVSASRPVLLVRVPRAMHRLHLVANGQRLASPSL